MKLAKNIISGVFAVFLLIGLVSRLLGTDFGLHRWAPMWLQWVIVGLMIVWWIGIFIQIARFRLE